MTMANLHTLDHDVLFELLAVCPNLITLRCLILTHPVLSHVFSGRRRLILRRVFRTQHTAHFSRLLNERDVATAEAYILQVKHLSPLDGIALREALWPELERQLPGKQASKWATALLGCYHKAGLKDDALAFAQTTTGPMIKMAPNFESDTRIFLRAVVRTYMAAKLVEEAVALQKIVLQFMNARSPQHVIWAKDSIATYMSTGDLERAQQLQHDTWEQYRVVIGAESHIALDWARGLIRHYQSQKQYQEAIAFHETVRSALNPTTVQYIAWSRQQILMHQRQNQDAEALIVTEQVWRHLNTDSTGYLAWTSQLSDAYDAIGRPEDAIAVCEAAWSAIGHRLSRNMRDSRWKYRARGAGLLLAKVYRRHQRIDDANVLEARCKELNT